MKRIILATTIAAATFAGAASAEQYVCETEQVTGFAPDGNGVWRDSRFTDLSTYLVDTEALAVREFGTDTEYTNCEAGSDIMRDWMTCSKSWDTRHFTFNSVSKRFAEASTLGSVNNGDTPWIAIGTCAELGS